MTPAHILVTAALTLTAQHQTEAIRSTLIAFQTAVQHGEPESLRPMFTAGADYCDAWQSLTGADDVTAVFAQRPVWSERTPPLLQDQRIRFAGSSSAFVLANVVQYGSVILKSSVPLEVWLENDSGQWKISSWRSGRCR